MRSNYNAEIENILSSLKVPFNFLYYSGNAETYITYQQTDKENPLAGDDEIIGYIMAYDIDVYSKGNYFPLIENLIHIMTLNGWTYQPTRESADMFENDTNYFHKTICFAKESEG
jgi:hypothetical protein